MQRWRGLDEIPAGWGRCVVTIGVFDGLHRGHQQIVARARAVAGELGLPTVLVTFTPHPSEVVRPGSHPPQLITNTRKAELADELGVDVVVFVPFTLEFSKLSPEEFLHQAVVAELRAAAVVVGENFRFGHRAAGTVATLADLGRRWGFAAEGVPLLAEGGRPISSTYIRSCVEAGDLAAAAHALGRPHRLDGVVVRGAQRGRDLGYPTANVRPVPFAAVPADGIYAGRVVRLDEWGNTLDREPALPAAVSVGSNPTFEGRHRSVEAFVLDFDADLYGQNLGVEFVHRLRGMVRFDSVPELIEQMADDVVQTRQVLDRR
ncbi:MAG: bifunctional riboflavin kinase/FAD synthetase [Actinobacteria bacterium]|nr:bifunctional riboflavin kinase/FAD synthetase [Actinomycetota bacterium]